jgi:hypothetical protein
MDEFLLFYRQQRRISSTPRPRRVPTRLPRTRTQPKEMPPGPYSNLRAPRTPDRRHMLYFPSPALETTSHCYPLPDPTATACTRRPLATCPTARSAHRKSAISLPRHSGGPLLHVRTARRPRYAHMMARTGATHISTETRSPTMDASPLRQQRTLHLLPDRDRLPALRHLMLRLGSSGERAIRSTGFLVSGILTTAHHMEGVEGCTTRSPFDAPAHARGQSSSGG